MRSCAPKTWRAATAQTVQKISTGISGLRPGRGGEGCFEETSPLPSFGKSPKEWGHQSPVLFFTHHRTFESALNWTVKHPFSKATERIFRFSPLPPTALDKCSDFSVRKRNDVLPLADTPVTGITAHLRLPCTFQLPDLISH